MHQCIINVPLPSHWSEVTYSQAHDSPVLKALSLKSLRWISVKTFADSIQFGQNPSPLEGPELLEEKL